MSRKILISQAKFQGCKYNCTVPVNWKLGGFSRRGISSFSEEEKAGYMIFGPR
jgi:hypothetical protein